jgi:hypothetical protein
VCGREGPESPELPLREPPGCLPRVVPGEIKVLPSDGREMAKRLVGDSVGRNPAACRFHSARNSNRFAHHKEAGELSATEQPSYRVARSGADRRRAHSGWGLLPRPLLSPPLIPAASSMGRDPFGLPTSALSLRVALTTAAPAAKSARYKLVSRTFPW